MGLAAEANAVIEINKAVYDQPESKSGYKRTGRLRGSLTHVTEASEHAVYIGTNVEYGKFVELGTRKMAARPFLKPAIVEHVDEYKAVAEAQLKK